MNYRIIFVLYLNNLKICIIKGQIGPCGFKSRVFLGFQMNFYRVLAVWHPEMLRKILLDKCITSVL